MMCNEVGAGTAIFNIATRLFVGRSFDSRQGQDIFRFLNLLKPTGHVMHQQFNIQQLYVLPTLYLFVLYLSENKQ